MRGVGINFNPLLSNSFVAWLGTNEDEKLWNPPILIELPCGQAGTDG